jgi:hypothetical protein
MTRQYRIQLYWPGRTDPRSLLGQQIAALLGEIKAIHPGLAGFLFHDEKTRAPAPAGSAEACDEALRQQTIHWKTGNTERTSYEQRFFVERRVAPPVEFTVTCGIEPLGLDPIWTPNRLDFRVSADVGDERASRPVLEAVLRCAVSVYQPDWAYAGTATVPQAPVPPFADGAPVVGWMTYLKMAFPPVPQTLPQPSVVYPVGSHGTLIVAHPELFHESDPAQRAAVERVRATLKAAGVLIPPSDIGRI